MASKFKTAKGTCKECGGPVEAKSKAGRRPEFCGKVCQKAFHNRRLVRGALLYDLYMAHKWDRQHANHRSAQLAMDRLISRYRDEDFRERGGRVSWGDWETVLDNDMSLTGQYIHADRNPWSNGRQPKKVDAAQ